MTKKKKLIREWEFKRSRRKICRRGGEFKTKMVDMKNKKEGEGIRVGERN